MNFDVCSGKALFKDLQVVGVSADAVEKQAKFVESQKITVCACSPTLLPDTQLYPQYPLLSDADGEVRKAYSVGRGLLGLVSARVTFCIDEDGIIRYTVLASYS